jgi:hypothetical protein
MAIQAKIISIQNTQKTVRVNTSGESLSAAKPVTLKNQIKEIRSIEDFGDVQEVNVTAGATLVYNSTIDKYEVRPLELADLGNLDGGTF